MNAYKINLWQGVKHNGVHVTYTLRSFIIHAKNETDARHKIVLREGYTKELSQLKIDVSPEFVESVYKIGTVKIEPFYVYSDNYYEPIPVGIYKAKRKNDWK